MSLIYALDPGSTQSAVVMLAEGGKLAGFYKADNSTILSDFYGFGAPLGSLLVVERVESYGMPVGVEVFDTVMWAGRFIEAWRGVRPSMQDAWALMGRRDVKLHLCGSVRATDATIRQALIDRYGPGKDKAIGSKTSPGPLYGLKADLWAALALGVTYADTWRLPAASSL